MGDTADELIENVSAIACHGGPARLHATANAAARPDQSTPMSLRSDFYALPLLHRIVVTIASVGFGLMCGAVANMYLGSGVAVAAAGGCGGLLLYHVVARVALTVFMVGAVKTLKPSEDEKARKEKKTAGRRARSQLARARALMARRQAGGGERRDAGAQPSRSDATPRAPTPPEPGNTRRRRTFGRRAPRRPP